MVGKQMGKQSSLDFFYRREGEKRAPSGEDQASPAKARDLKLCAAPSSQSGPPSEPRDQGAPRLKRLKKLSDTEDHERTEQGTGGQDAKAIDVEPEAGPVKVKAASPKKSTPKKKKAASSASGKKAEKGAVEGVGKSSVAAAHNHKTYDSLDGATWKANEPVPYVFLATAFDKIGEDTKRLAKAQILTEAMRTVIATTPEDLLPLVYLSVNAIAPAHEGVELGIGDATLIKALAETTGRKESAVSKEYKQAGDLGKVAQSCRSTQRTLFQPEPLTVRKVFHDFTLISRTEGMKSMDRKRDVIKSLLASSKKNEASYIVRALQGKLRIGLAEQTVLTSLAHACALEEKGKGSNPVTKGTEAVDLADKLESSAQAVKQAYSECPCYDKLVPALLEHGVSSLADHCHFQVGIPVKPMLAKPTTGVQEVLDKFEGQEFTCEYKYDGERAQIHLDSERGVARIFSRNSEENTGKYPDVIEGTLPLILSPGTSSVVLDGEVVAYDVEKGEILPFQQLQSRKRKDVAVEDVKVSVCVFAFDLLYLNGQTLLQSSLVERREALRSACKEVEGKFYFAKEVTSQDIEALQHFLDDAIAHNTEGLIVKTMDSTYEPSKRSLNWLKLKKDYMDAIGDSLDVVVVGAWFGKGKRTGNYGTFLLACYNDESEEFETISKIGTGFSEEDLDAHFKQLSSHAIDCARPYYKWGEKLEPDVWFDAKVVWEVKAADLTLSPVHKAAAGLADDARGIALRFPRFLTVREDKAPTACTTSEEVCEMYRKQFDKKDASGAREGEPLSDEDE